MAELAAREDLGRPCHIDRGYEKIEEKLRLAGAQIQRLKIEQGGIQCLKQIAFSAGLSRDIASKRSEDERAFVFR